MIRLLQRNSEFRPRETGIVVQRSEKPVSILIRVALTKLQRIAVWIAAKQCAPARGAARVCDLVILQGSYERVQVRNREGDVPVAPAVKLGVSLRRGFPCQQMDLLGTQLVPDTVKP